MDKVEKNCIFVKVYGFAYIIMASILVGEVTELLVLKNKKHFTRG